jgi:hypothetical protein
MISWLPNACVICETHTCTVAEENAWLCDKIKTYRLRFGRIYSRLNMRIINLSWWLRFATCLLLIPCLIKYHSKSLSWCRIIDIPFTKFWQWPTCVLVGRKTRRELQSRPSQLYRSGESHTSSSSGFKFNIKYYKNLEIQLQMFSTITS